MIFHESLFIETTKPLEVLDLTEKINGILKMMHVDKGLINLWTVHTTAALTINENDEGLWTDLLNKYNQLAPMESDYRHKPNAYAHIVSSIIKPDITIPVNDGEMVLGTWQRTLFIELDGPRKRTINVTIIGE